MESGVYQIRSKVDGRLYVGSSVNLEKRWKEHRRQLDEGKHHSRFLQRCWTKYGADAFEFSVIVYCHQDTVLMYEQFYIDELRPEFNTVPTAGSQRGLKHSDETRRKMSASRRRDFSPMTGKSHTAETKARISRTKSGKKYGAYDQERVKKTASAMRLSKGAMSEETAREIKRLKALGMKHRDVANDTGVSYWAVADIARGHCFAWVA